MNPLTLSQLAIIASLRCQALSWDEIARRLQRDELALREQLANQRADYQRALALAKEELLDELLFAGLAKLKQTLTCGKATLEADAAKALLRYALHQQQQLAKRPTTPNVAPTSTPPSMPDVPPPEAPPAPQPHAPKPVTTNSPNLRPQHPIQTKNPPLLHRTG